MDYSTGFAVGVLIGIVLMAFVLLLIKRKTGICKGKYDERQLLARGKAFKYGFFTIISYFGALCFLQIATEAGPAEDFSLNCLGIFLGITVYAVNAIWNDAYISFQENARTYMVLFFAGGIVNLGFAFVPAVVWGEAFRLFWLNLLAGIMALFVALVMIAKGLRDRRQEEAE